MPASCGACFLATAEKNIPVLGLLGPHVAVDFLFAAASQVLLKAFLG